MSSAHDLGCGDVPPDVIDALRRKGFRFVRSEEMRSLLAACGELSDWPQFAASWNDLEPDSYLAQVGRHRRRRFAVYRAEPGRPIERGPHQPHYQSSHYNALQGDIERWFAPISPDIGAGASLQAILEFCRGLFERLAASSPWHIEVHQFRIEASVEEAGEPTPEGVHRDGVDFVLVLLIDRQNIVSGTTTIHSPDGKPLGSFTLREGLDGALLDDARVFHGVTPVRALEAGRRGHRDVLVVTWRRRGG